MDSNLTGFVQIGRRTSLYTPPEPASGQLVVICTWLGAGRKHIAKYTSIHQKIAPRSRILLIQSDVPILISSYKKQRLQILPAVKAVLDTLAGRNHSSTSSLGEHGNVDASASKELSSEDGRSAAATLENRIQPKLILHTFSNGGTNTATQLLLVLRDQYQSPLPITGVVFDSCPAKGTYRRSYNAMKLSLPRGVAFRLLGPPAVHFSLVVLYTWIALGNENPASLQRRTMLDDDIVSRMAPSTAQEPEWERRACYLFSKEDRMCLWTDVSEHAQDARRKGWHVKEVLFEGSAHCAHLSQDPERYLEALTGIWWGYDEGPDEKLSARL